METKTLFFGKVNDIEKPLARQTNKEEQAKMNSIRNKAGDITTDPADTKRLKKYYKQLYT